ncbi:MAG: hypothetical protein KJ774_09035 [Firmicutes bacterium]|nr:hypothetical protein [Bacillota bacterium]
MRRYLKINKAIFCEKYWRREDRQRGLLIESEAFPEALRYVIKDQSLILLSGTYGIFCFDLTAAPALLAELSALVDCYQADRDCPPPLPSNRPKMLIAN